MTPMTERVTELTMAAIERQGGKATEATARVLAEMAFAIVALQCGTMPAGPSTDWIFRAPDLGMTNDELAAALTPTA